MLDQQTRNNAFANLTPELQSLYQSPLSGDQMYTIYANNEGDFEHYIPYAELIGDTILGFHKTTELPQLLQTEAGIDADIAHRITADLLDFMGPVIERERSIKNALPLNLHSTEQERPLLGALAAMTPKTNNIPNTLPIVPSVQTEVPQQPADTLPTADLEPIVAPKAPLTPQLDSVQPMRTMEGDITRVHGYGAYRALYPDEPGAAAHTEDTIRSASQESILQRPKLTESPKYTHEE